MMPKIVVPISECKFACAVWEFVDVVTQILQISIQMMPSLVFRNELHDQFATSQIFSTRPYASSTASFIISESVGCGKMVWINSSSVVSRFIATT